MVVYARLESVLVPAYDSDVPSGIIGNGPSIDIESARGRPPMNPVIEGSVCQFDTWLWAGPEIALYGYAGIICDCCQDVLPVAGTPIGVW